MPSKRIGPVRFAYFPNEERCLLPRCGMLNTRAEDAITSYWLAVDGRLEVYVYWIRFEIAVRLQTRRAKGIKGAL